MPSRIARRIVSLIAALLVIAGVFAVVDIKRGPSAQSVLDDARAFVQHHQSVRFVGTMAIRVQAGKSDLGAAQTLKSHLTGEVQSKGRTHAVITAGTDGATETVTVGSVVYVRDAESKAALTKAKYAKIDTAKAIAGVMGLDAKQAKDLDIGGVLAAAHSPKKLFHEGKRTTIQADVNATKLIGAVTAKDIDSITVRMDVRKGGEVLSIVQVTRGSGATITTTLSYADWGETVAVVEPTADQIDPTPGIEEEKIARWKDSPLFMPKGIPAGWALDIADVLPKEETTEGCAEVELDYSDPADPDNGYLYLYEFPNKCAQPFSGPGVVAFSAGAYTGFGSSSKDEGTLVQITVGATTIQAETDLTFAELATVLKDLVPLNLATKPGAIAGIGNHKTSV